MSKKLLYIFLIVCALGTQSCKRYVCPAYFSAYNIEPKSPNKFFNYFLPDTAKTPVVLKDTIPNSHRLLKFEKGEEPTESKLFASKGKNKYGLMATKKSPLDLIIPNRKANFMKHVKAEITISELDSLEAIEMYAVYDSLFSPDRFKRDQYIYMELFGFAILDSLDSLRELKAEEEAIADTTGANLTKKERRKLRKEERKKRRRLRKEGLSEEDKRTDSTDTEGGNDEADAGKRKRIKEKPTLKGKKEKKGGLLKGGKKKGDADEEKEDKKKKKDDDDGGG